MKRFLLALVLAALVAAPFPSFAQSAATRTVPGYNSTTNCSPGQTLCYVPQLASIAGTQTAVTLSSGAVGLTVPTNAILAVITVSGSNNTSGICAYWRDDGTSPTGSAGQPLASLAGLVYFVRSLPIKLIQATGASCTATISYYG